MGGFVIILLRVYRHCVCGRKVGKGHEISQYTFAVAFFRHVLYVLSIVFADPIYGVDFIVLCYQFDVCNFRFAVLDLNFGLFFTESFVLIFEICDFVVQTCLEHTVLYGITSSRGFALCFS